MESNERVPIVENKIQEHIQAQVELFADKGVKEFSGDQEKFLRYSSKISKEIDDWNNLPSDLPEDMVDLIQRNREAYFNFLNQEKFLDTSSVEQNIRNYKDKFQPLIIELKKKTAEGNPKEIQEYLGSGGNGSAFLIEVGGKKYAAKFSKSITQINYEIKPLIKARGIPYTAQLVNYSFEDGVIITELLPGKEVTNFTPEEAPDYSDEDIIQLIETVKELDSRGLVIDPKASNFMYDREKGFSILDYHIQNKAKNYGLPQEIMDLLSFNSALTARRFEKIDYKSPDFEEKTRIQTTEKYKIFLLMSVKFLGILKDKYPDILIDSQKKHNENKKNPNIVVSEIIDRKNIPDNPDLKFYLKKLEDMGF